MRQDGNTIRLFGSAHRYDRWFLDKAKGQRDLVAVAQRLAAIASKDKSVDSFADDFDWFCSELERFREESPDVYEAAIELAKATRTPKLARARLNWAATVMPYNQQLDALREANAPADPKLTDAPLKAAAELITVSPDHALVVAAGWGTEYDHRHSGNCKKRFDVEGQRKLDQLLQAVPRMTPDRRDDLIGYPIANGRVSFDPTRSRDLIIKYADAFDSLDASAANIFDRERITVEDAKRLAPAFARNPHPEAAVIRAIASSGSLEYGAIAEAMFKHEAWRFSSSKQILDLAKRSATTSEVDEKQLAAKHKSFSDPYEQLRRQIDAKAKSADRLRAYETLLSDLLSEAPKLPGAMQLWDALFDQAPNADAVEMMKRLTGEATDERMALLRRAADRVRFGDKRNGKMPWQAVVHHHQRSRNRIPVQKEAGDLIEHLHGQLTRQIKADAVRPEVLGMWLHTADLTTKSAKSLIDSLMRSPAYAKLPQAYRDTMAEPAYFGHLALSQDALRSHPWFISEPLLDLPEKPDANAVEAAISESIKRAREADAPVALLGLEKVAGQTPWTETTRRAVLTLFKDNAPLGAYPGRRGYEPLVIRLVEDAREAGRWVDLEPYLTGLWQAAEAKDHHRHAGVPRLVSLAQAALDAEAYSVALAAARCGLSSRVGLSLKNNTDETSKRWMSELGQVQGKASIALGIIDIPVDETDPAYPIFRSQAEFAIGNTDSAWELYEKNADQLLTIVRELTVPYCLWLLERNIEMRESERAEALIKALTVWSRQASGTFTATQEGELKIAYADAAFQQGSLQTAKAWYRRVADAEEYNNTPLQYEAKLRSVRVDRVSKDFGSALAELDQLMLIRDQNLRTRVQYARAEVFYDQERYADAFEEASAVLKREPNHPDALILLGQAQLEMRKLVDASEIELGVSREQAIIVPGETIKINLSDPALNISGVGAEIEVEIWTKSGDRERLMLYQLGDDKTKFRAEIPTRLGKRQPGDKVLQILGRDEVRYGYSKRFRDKMSDLPPDPDVVIAVASDASLSASAGAFPPRQGERQLDLEELGVSAAQQALGTRQVRPGNPVYIRVTDPDQGKTDGIDEIQASVQTSNGDVIPRLILKETGPYTGEFQATIPTGPAQALAYASESAPGRDPNMVISAQNYPGWAGAIGSKDPEQFFTVDLNDRVELDRMTIRSDDPAQVLTRFVVQTSFNGTDWHTRARYPEDPAPRTGSPRITAFPNYGRNAIPVNLPEGFDVPENWRQAMEIASAREDVNYGAFNVANFNSIDLDLPSGGHPQYGVVIRYRAYFYQPAAAIRTFRVAGMDGGAKAATLLLIDGEPAEESSDDPLTITRELPPGLHEIEVWHLGSRNEVVKRKPSILHDVAGQDELLPMPDSAFDPANFPEPIRAAIPEPTSVTASDERPGEFEVAFGERTRARLIRLAIVGHEGPAPAINRITLTDRDGVKRLPVATDYQKLRSNDRLEVVPGDRISVRYEDDRVVSERRAIQQRSLSVAFNTATIDASFLTYLTSEEGERELVIEPIRRFKLNDNVGIVVNDPDLDQTRDPDELKVTVKSSGGASIEITAVETGPNTGEFLGKVFPVSGEPRRDSEIQVPVGGTITAIYRDDENLEPGIPTDRTITIEHAAFKTPALAVYDATATALPPPPRDSEQDAELDERGPEIVKPRQSIAFTHAQPGASGNASAIIGSAVRFDVLASHLAFANSSQTLAYVQTESGRRAYRAKGNALSTGGFDIRVPGTLLLTATPSRSASTPTPPGYVIGQSAEASSTLAPLDEGRFAFSVPLVLDDTPIRSYATEEARSLSTNLIPDALAVRPGDKVYVGFAYLDPQGKAQWLTATIELTSHAFLDVMDARYRRDIVSAFVGEKVFVRVIAPDQDKTPERDLITVNLRSKNGVSVPYSLRESEVHSGVFKGSFGLSYDDQPTEGKLPSVALHGLPVKYGDVVTVAYDDSPANQGQLALELTVNKGADGTVEPFTKRYGEDGVAVQTTFTLAECFFELAKYHRKMDQESLARREMAHAQKLLSEAIASHRDEDLQAHAEYLLGNLAQEYADLSENDASKRQMYQDALARFSKIPIDYPETEFAPKAQFKKGLVYEKLGEVDIAVEEYVKLAYKYPEHELIPSVMSRLGAYFQSLGQAHKAKAESLEQQEGDAEAKGEAIKFREMATSEFRNAALVFKKLQERFPNDALAGLAGLRSAQNFMRAGDFNDAIEGFQKVIDVEAYDDKTVRSQAMFWQGISNERIAQTEQAYQLYRRTTFDFPDSVWAKQARGRLADPVFAKFIEIEKKSRERMLEALRDQ
ncbi:MAG: tetratricopeptide repeat protein [Phycisphaeraceae bacterium]